MAGKNNFVNGQQTTQERRDKYNRIIKAGYPDWVARRLRDWTQSHIRQFLEANNPSWYKELKELKHKNVRKKTI